MPRKRKRKKPATSRPNTPARNRGPAAAPRADYDATTDKQKRSAPRSTIKSEDKLLTQAKRRQLQATGQDQMRNFAVAGWMVRKHTSYVSRFVFSATTKDRGFERALEAFIAERSKAANFYAGGRLSLQAGMTMTERHAVVDGDHFWHMLRSGAAQFIESDLVYNAHDLPSQYSQRDFTHGVELDRYGKPRNYLLCRREGNSRRFEKVARAYNVFTRAYWPRANTVRGVSPLSSALNTLQDLYEGFDYQLIKAKLHALFGVAILTDGEDGVGGFDIKQTVTSGEENDDDADNVTHEFKEHYLKPGVATVMSLPTASKIEMLESKTPSGEFRDFSELMMQVAMLAVDLPYIFFNAKDGSFSIHRTARLEYEKSCREKRDANIELLNHWTLRQIMRGIEDGDFFYPSSWSLDDITWEWSPEATPWFDELDEIDAAISGIAAGLIDPYRWIKEHGHGDGDDVLRNIAKFQKHAQEQGLQLEWARPPITLAATQEARHAE